MRLTYRALTKDTVRAAVLQPQVDALTVLDAVLSAEASGAVPEADYQALVAMACAHHRLGWVHPFPVGNGRVMRLHTHLVLHALGLTHGLWSPLRGFVRSQERYYRLLAEADNTRRGDLDGRGNLSEQALVAWADYVLDICLDQVQFMQQMLDFDAIKQRIEAALVVESTVRKSGVRTESLRALHYLFLSGEELARGEFKSMLGMSDRLATDALGALVKRGTRKAGCALACRSMRCSFCFPSCGRKQRPMCPREPKRIQPRTKASLHSAALGSS